MRSGKKTTPPIFGTKQYLLALEAQMQAEGKILCNRTTHRLMVQQMHALKGKELRRWQKASLQEHSPVLKAYRYIPVVEGWTGKLRKGKVRIRVLQPPHQKKRRRKPILQIHYLQLPPKDTLWFQDVQGTLIKIRLLPPIQMRGESRLSCRLSYYYRTKGSHQGGPVTSFVNHGALFSHSKKDMDTITQMLARHTKDVR